MKQYILIMLIVVFSFVPKLASADSSAWVGWADVNYVTVQPNGRIYLILKAAVPDLSCNGNNYGHLEFDTNAPHFSEQYALVLAALTAGRQLQVYVNGCGHYPIVQNTRMK